MSKPSYCYTIFRNACYTSDTEEGDHKGTPLRTSMARLLKIGIKSLGVLGVTRQPCTLNL